MENESIEKRVLHLREVEKLSARQIAKCLGIGRRLVSRILKGNQAPPVPRKPALLKSFLNLIAYWYSQYPRLQAKQIYERLLSYGYSGSYPSVARFTRTYRKKKPEAYHVLTFLSGEEAQIDWFFYRHPKIGMVAGFLYVLAYSRYAWGKFYPRTTFEFFLAGHLECFEHLKGLAHRHRYDNLRSIVIQRQPSRIEYNGQFLDFARFFGFSIHVCNPASGHEKGRVERPIRDLRGFLYGQESSDLMGLNGQLWEGLRKRNQSVHRSTGKTPLGLLSQEKLLGLPCGVYPPTRTIPVADVSKTALVEFDTNRYTVPSHCAAKKAQIIAWPEKIEIYVSNQRVAVHPRSFERRKLIENPLHAEKLLERTGRFKYERIFQLVANMDPVFKEYLAAQEDETEKIQAACALFRLLKTYSRTLLASAIRELAGMGTFKIKALWSLLNLPSPKDPEPIWPQNTELLKLQYPPRDLKDYDPTS